MMMVIREIMQKMGGQSMRMLSIPLRMAAYILYLLVTLFVLLLLPKRLFQDAKPLLSWAFAGVILILEFMCMLTIKTSVNCACLVHSKSNHRNTKYQNF